MNKEEFKNLVQGVCEAGKIKRGEKRASRVFEYTPLNVKEIRGELRLSQEDFSQLILVSVKTLRNWEQGRRQPRGPAVALLTILKNDPKHAISALH